MANKKKAIPKNQKSETTNSKKKNKPAANNKGKITISQSQPLKFTIEVLIRTDNSGSREIKTQPLKVEGGVRLLEDDRQPNFSYSFDLRGNVKVVHFIVGEKSLEDPPNEGSFFTPVNDLRVPPHIRVTVIAIENSPGGSGSLSMNYNGKAVFTPPAELIKNGAGLGFSNEVTLPE